MTANRRQHGKLNVPLIRSFCQERGWTMLDLSERMAAHGLASFRLDRFERKGYSPSVDTVAALKKVTGLSMDDLVVTVGGKRGIAR